MPIGWYGLICCICFSGLTPEQCWTDEFGNPWDLCATGDCAELAGAERKHNGRNQ
jgi:hypothetical protein